MRDNDTVEEVVHVMDHDTVLFFSPDGICRSLKAYQIPVSSKTAMGAPLTQVQIIITISFARSLTLSHVKAYHIPVTSKIAMGAHLT